jgi:hypothetical protein
MFVEVRGSNKYHLFEGAPPPTCAFLEARACGTAAGTHVSTS